MAARIWIATAVASGRFSSAPPPPISNATTPSTHPARAAVVETWTGVGVQPDADSEWTLEMRIDRAAAVGTRLGTIEYPSLGCSSDLIREPDRGVAIVAIERLRVNPENVCVDGGTIVIRDDGETLDWQWSYPGGAEGATSTLRRKLP